MNWYKIAKTDSIIWHCPITGFTIIAPRHNKEILEYSVYGVDGSYFDSFETWEEANRAAKAYDSNVNFLKSGRLQE